ncbi:sigma-54 dependent transcriptional regulator [Myxococcota bacterium]|nr:sigma-54 dependent transcriptional regulator [Myxococcota bacterium]MBU1429066.1 sigma-54 dependent transcriptional regulator [Myxococcota bacterium]MBU1900134.1 sigma-54 dependent transcriptional regulator [Myxococcota bacterium]
MSERILVADDELSLRKTLGILLRRLGYEVETAADGQEALEALSAAPFDAVITDLKMPRLDGMELLREIVSRWAEMPVIIITAHGTVETAVNAVKLGAFDFITKPYDKDELRKVVEKALATRRLGETQARAVQDANGRFGLIGASTSMQQVFRVVDKVAKSPSTVLITGESGTGKELIARALHEQSNRASQAFIRVNCAAIPNTLIESELFGYEKGAFTGAATSKPGRFELADQGTLFLDEIGEISTEMQVKLLRAIQEGELERVGGISTRRVDVRLITATNRDLLKEVREGRFREDLYYRLNVVPIVLPPLRARAEDIPLLVEHLLEKYAQRLARAVRGISASAMTRLMAYDWPGNIRELENMLERTILFCDGEIIEAEDLPVELAAPGDEPGCEEGTTLKDAVRLSTQRVERAMIERALEETQGNITRAAKRLSISRKSLQIKMKELGLRDD